MPHKLSCTPTTAAERLAYSQCGALDRLFASPMSQGYMPMSMACQVSTIDAFPSVLNGDFELDGPVMRALAMQLAQTNPDQAALLLASRIPVEQLPAAAKDDQAINRLLSATGDSLYGGGNILGNASALNEAALRAAWQRQARNGFQALISGAKTGTIRLSPHITIEPRNIGKGGQLRKGARMIVRVRGLPMTVLHSLPSPFISKAGGQFSAMRVGARDMQRMGQATAALADARIQSSRLLRAASGKVGGGVLAFGPTAALDFGASARWVDNSVEVDWKGFAIRSAKSQSGNLVGFVAGAVAVGVVSTVGWPVIVIGLAAGLVAQIAWGATGMDEMAESKARELLR
jgi:hypothetical protein